MTYPDYFILAQGTKDREKFYLPYEHEGVGVYRRGEWVHLYDVIRGIVVRDLTFYSGIYDNIENLPQTIRKNEIRKPAQIYPFISSTSDGVEPNNLTELTNLPV